MHRDAGWKHLRFIASTLHPALKIVPEYKIRMEKLHTGMNHIAVGEVPVLVHYFEVPFNHSVTLAAEF